MSEVPVLQGVPTLDVLPFEAVTGVCRAVWVCVHIPAAFRFRQVVTVPDRPPDDGDREPLPPLPDGDVLRPRFRLSGL